MNKSNIFNIIITALLVVIMLQMCNKRNPVPGTVIVYRDTTWIIKDSTIHSRPQLVTHERSTDSVLIKEYYPDANYEKLLIQYNTLLEEFLARNTFGDSLKIDSIGYVHVSDSVTRNSIVGRSYHYDLKYPRIHDSVTVYPATRQVYVGVGMAGDKYEPFRTASAGFLYKNKKDNILGLSGTLSNKNQWGIMVQSYWKIKL